MATSMTSTPRILIVDDNRDVLASLRRTLRRTGFELVCVDQPGDAVELLSRESFELLLSDIDMPVINGHELMKQAQALQPTMIRVFVTGAGSMDAAVRAINEGEVHRFVRKPFDAVELRDLVKGAVERKAELDLAAEASSRTTRRRELYAHLEAEHPGITDCRLDDNGVYRVDTRRLADAVREIGLRGFIDN